MSETCLFFVVQVHAALKRHLSTPILKDCCHCEDNTLCRRYVYQILPIERRTEGAAALGERAVHCEGTFRSHSALLKATA